MSKFSWLQFSDLHFSNREGLSTSDAREKMHKKLKEIEDCDYIFITGDVANKSNYSTVKENLKKLTDNIPGNSGIKNAEKVFWTVGNHDISRHSQKAELIHEIRKSGNMKQAYDTAMIDDYKGHIISGLGYKEYFKSTYELGSDDSIQADMRQLGTHNNELHRIVQLQHLNLIILNTCLLSCDDNDEGNLFVLDSEFTRQFKAIYNEEAVRKMIRDKKPSFVLAHHGRAFLHPDEQKRLANLFKGKVDLYLCGHSHELLHDLYYDPEAESDSPLMDDIIHQYTCGIGTLDGDSSKMSFLHGRFEDNSIRITAYVFEDDEWTKYEKGKFRNIEIPRFKRQYRLKRNSFKLFVTGAQGVGKTAITKRLMARLENTEALQTAEVDFQKDGFRDQVEEAEKFIEKRKNSYEKKMKAEDGFIRASAEERWKGYMEAVTDILGEEDVRKAVIDTSYKQNMDDLDKQSGFIFPKLMNAVESHTEKGIPAIVEGLNIPLAKLIEYYRVKERDDNEFNMDSIMIINLTVNTKENHEILIKRRIDDRQLDDESRKKHLENLDNLFKINEYYTNRIDELKVENPDMKIYNIDNSIQREKQEVVQQIIDLIEESGNFYD